MAIPGPDVFAGPSPVTVIYTFSATQSSPPNVVNSDGASPAARLLVGSDGTFYGTTTTGGNYGAGNVFSVTSNGIFNDIFDFRSFTENNGLTDSDFGPNELASAPHGSFFGTTQRGGTNQDGTIFKVSPTGQEVDVHIFSAPGENSTNSDGINPSPALVLGPDGNYYGTTQAGGTNGTGTIFQLTPNGNFTTVYTFTAYNASSENSDGAMPNSLTLGADGNFYGTCELGGANAEGTFFEITTGGTFTLLYSFGATTNDAAYPQAQMIQAADGNFYGTSANGGAFGAGTVFSASSNGTINLLYSFTGGDDGGDPMAPLALSSNGNFYGVTDEGINAAGTIFELTPSGVFGTVFSFPATDANGANTVGTFPQAGLTVGRDGNLYGSCLDGGTNGDGVIFKFNPNITPPFIITSPVGGIYSAGSSPTLTATGYGAGNLSYQWYKNNAALRNSGHISGAASTNLQIQSLVSADAGSYALVVRNAYGGATSVVAVLTVVIPPPIIAQPATPVHIPDGGTLSLLVRAGGANLNYFWLLDGAPLMDGSSVSGATITGSGTSNLVIAPVDFADSGSYSVVIQDSNMIASVTSRVSTVTVGVGPSVLPSGGVTSLVGTRAVLNATASGTAPLFYQWKKIGGTASANVSGATNSTLTLRNVTLTSAGSYFLVVTNYFGSITSAVATVTVVFPPSVTSQPSPPANVVEGGSFTLRVATAGSPTAWQWRFNTTNLSDGGNVFGSSSDTLVLNPAYVTNSGSYSVVVSNANGAVTSAVCRVIVNADRVPPTVAVISPVAGARTNNPVFSGTASDNARVTNVFWWITNFNNGPILSGSATLTRGGSNWSIAAIPFPGTNTLAVQSQDFSGLRSRTATATFFYKVTNAISIFAAGDGIGSFGGGTASIRGDTVPANGAVLNIGEGYTISAIVGANSLFSNWVGVSDVNNFNTTRPNLSFIMQTNLVLTADFTSNFFLPLHGIYNGLFFNTNAVAPESSGTLQSLTLGTNGVFTARLLNAGTPYSFGGTWTVAGTYFTNLGLASATGGPLKLSLSLDRANQVITGTVSNALWTANLLAVMAGSNIPSSEFTFLLTPPVNATASIPPGDGYAAATNHLGTFTFSGSLGDGAAFSPTVPQSQHGDLPIYATPYGNTGLLLGWINLNSLQSGSATNTLTWIKKASRSYPPYTNGLSSFVTVQGGPWTNPPAQVAAIPMSAGDLVISNANLLLNFNVAISNTDAIVKLGSIPANTLTGSVTAKTGVFTVTFGNGAGRATTTGQGVLLQTQTNGGGYFLGTTNAGAITLTPAP